MKGPTPRIISVVSIVGAAAAVGVLLMRWIGYAAGGAVDVCGSERWTPWTVQYESTGSTPVAIGFGLTPLGLRCSSGANVTYPDEPLASHLVVLALILVVLAVALRVRPASSHPRFFAWTVAISMSAAAVAVPAGLGTAAYAISFARGGWIDCGVPPVSVVGRAAIEAVHAPSTVFSVVPTGPLCTFASPAGDVTVFDGDVAFGSVFVVALAVATAFAILAARSRKSSAGL